MVVIAVAVVVCEERMEVEVEVEVEVELRIYGVELSIVDVGGWLRCRWTIAAFHCCLL